MSQEPYRPVTLLVSATKPFGFKLYAEILKQSDGNNVFTSPLSVSLALAMAFNGAEGQTKEAIAGALHLPAISLDEINHAYSRLILLLSNIDPKIELQIANSLWGREGINLKPEFI